MEGLDKFYERLKIEENNERIKRNRERDEQEEKPVTSRELMVPEGLPFNVKNHKAQNVRVFI